MRLFPRNCLKEEQEAYRELLEEKKLEAMDASLPKYEEGIRAAKELGIAHSEWIDKMKEKIRAINPSSEALNIQITEWQPKELPPQAQASTPASASVQSSYRWCKRRGK